MNKLLHQFFTNDHHRLEKLLDKAITTPEIDMTFYMPFRSGLLRHIKMEENILFPAAKAIDANKIQEILPQFRLEHGALTALMVPPPTPDLIKVIKHILEKHDFEEEKPGGLYDVCELLTQSQTQELLNQLEKTPEVPLHPPNPTPFAFDAAKRALVRAGYDYDEIIMM
ncbi:MAG TPA: hemerythrin domain-containing protein [Bacteroidia bacterium]|nr:hemerythrin domain-containing protein [Bacteroidia bacterium]QQR95495.1 MAG: hemerythrin domain-containing protein [Bacteroidota bacterium]MBP7715024.1 hemerythrin domain-containing protein [Bacteroidia bacterium]MBP8668069.1 hemerythrin domain-containing protein [Bacteroidia bacterium]HOZ90830.1 hemerythrin domain-containing protein [Bacteroidia bacterium]